MSGAVVHLGPDTCHRTRILASAGYTVYDCESLRELDSVLNGEACAVVLTTAAGPIASAAISLVRSRTSVPLILFGESDAEEDMSVFDLYVPPFTRPQEWISGVSELIDASRSSRGASTATPPVRSDVEGAAAAPQIFGYQRQSPAVGREHKASPQRGDQDGRERV